MASELMNQRDIEFMLYEFFDSESLLKRERYQDHDRHTFNEVIATAKTIAEKHFLPIRQKLDTHQPTFDGKKVHLIPELKPAIDAVIASGLSSATADYETSGMQLPPIIASIATSYLTVAGGVGLGYNMLTTANANLLSAHGSEDLIEKWVKPMRAGRFMGTMAMTEPGSGSGLGDLITKATKAEDGSYRISGNKIYISGGDHDLSENIVHLVLARLTGAPKGIRGISLFVVPKFLLNDDGSIGDDNEVALSGLFHKMGGRAQTSTALSFGEKNGAVGYLVGEENQGLKYMFHMMNEARIMVGTSAAVIGIAGYLYSLDYAKNRPQGRLPSSKDPLSPMVNIIEHADVRRMLLAQKAYAEGAFSLVLYGTQLSDDEKTAASAEEKEHAHLLLDFLTPIIKTWPSEYGTKANDLAIQVLGGHGYINEHPVELFYRDNRLNAIHEGTTGIQSLDLLTRKVPMNKMAGYLATLTEINITIEQAKNYQSLTEFSQQLTAAVKSLQLTTEALLTAMTSKNIDLALANSVKYLELFGHVIVAWLWLKQGLVATKALENKPHQSDENFYQGKLQTLQYFYRFELPQIALWSALLIDSDDSTYQMKAEWF
ncbi:MULTISPECIES: acyl-CoA dehydrogenase [unclassified Colwellia]|uniref:acyl-CoA dehydrogenase n=1 Tax=unclassified Colwellia TaxID=196834 RepID=UPI0015F45ED9|nr:MULTISPECIES: acyl-CoA dehydrogenase [unclassified Colwellia]MBA6338836.1 acyl-CoA dehydrogenase [Colwellia sp. BRX8-7]MBA6356978.1 acyl-CoA dehydrogenase [Colwellia sp. BRX8-3]MBA6360992.1 acyl-CoA dehydrogenase [Colwellia sp. BRX8-6]MBA6367054.1 acyl-CoA dehydrogenase [Colwellia sp. BRX8-5]MBA6375743.1 acyl-CoA dehydrogenase [Colwellia sp. BRX8-2]